MRRIQRASTTSDSRGLRDDAAGSGTNLRTKVAGGVRWGIVGSIATQVGRIAFMVVLMRMLGPENFGIVAQALVVVALGEIFLHLGLAASIIQRQKLTQSEVGSAFWMNMAMGCVLAALTFVAAPVLAGFFQTEELTAVLRVLALSFVLKGAAVVSTALLNRSMQFRDLAGLEVASTYISGVFGLAAAFSGAGYWALVIQTLAFDGVYLLGVLCIVGRPELSWSASAARGLWSFGSRVMGASLVNYFSDNGDKVLVARVLGATPLGLYSLAFRVLTVPIQILAQASRGILPAFSRLQADRQRLAGAFLNVTESVSFAVFPAMTLTILCAPIVVPVVFGDAWRGAIVPLQLLAGMTILYILTVLTGPVVLAVGRADWEFRWSIVNVVSRLVGVAIGLRWGIVGVAAAYLIVVALQTPIRLAITQRLIPISFSDYFRAVAPAGVSSFALALTWLLADYALRGMSSGLTLALATSMAGMAVYVLTVRAAWSDEFRRQVDFARLVVRGSRA